MPRSFRNAARLAVCLAMAALVFTASFSFADGPAFDVSGAYGRGQRTAVVNNPNPVDRLNLRKEPRTTAISFGKYYNGVTVTLLSDVRDGWIKVRVGNLEGYMQSKYLALDGTIVRPALPIVAVNNTSSQTLHLREAQSTSSASLGLYGNGTQVEVLGIGLTWYHVRVDGKTGFMMAKYLWPQLPYTLPAGSSSSGSSGSSGSPGTGGSWDKGPVGPHAVSNWPIPPSGSGSYFGVVLNPNPQDRLHLRAQPRSSARSLGKYYNGVRANINQRVNAQWVEVTIGNLTGYMNTDFFVMDDLPQRPLLGIPSAMPILVVSNPNAAKNLHLRETPSTGARSLGQYPNGTQVVLMGFTDEWAHVIVDGKMGFMQGKFLK